MKYSVLMIILIQLNTINILANQFSAQSLNCECRSSNDCFNQGLQLQSRGEIDNAIDFFTCAINKQSVPDPIFYLKRAYCYFTKGEQSKARDDMRTATNSRNFNKNSPNASIYYYNLGVLESLLNKDKEAKNYYDLAFNRTSESSERNKNIIDEYKILFNRAISNIYIGDFQAAINDIDSAIRFYNKKNERDESINNMLLHYQNMVRELSNTTGATSGNISESEKIGPANTWVFAIGINEYKIGNNLKHCVNDAKGFLSVLKSTGVENSIVNDGYTQVSGKTKLIEDKNATLRNLRGHMQYLSNNITSKDRLWLYFSGHGIESGLALHDEIYKFIDLLDDLSKISAYEIIIILDACHSGGLLVYNEINNSIASRQLSNLRVYVTSSSMIHPSLETVFSTSFNNALDPTNFEKVNRDKDSKITLHEAFFYAKNDMEVGITYVKQEIKKQLQNSLNEDEKLRLMKNLDAFEKIGIPQVSDEGTAKKITIIFNR